MTALRRRKRQVAQSTAEIEDVALQELQSTFLEHVQRVVASVDLAIELLRKEINGSVHAGTIGHSPFQTLRPFRAGPRPRNASVTQVAFRAANPPSFDRAAAARLNVAYPEQVALTANPDLSCMDSLLHLMAGGAGNLAAYLAAHVLLCLLPAFFIAGAMSALIPKPSITRWLGRNTSARVSYP